MPRFEIGDRVICTKPSDGNIRVVGISGTVVRQSVELQIDKPGVYFDEFVDGHTARGNAPDGFGWFCYANDLEPEPPLDAFPIPEIPF